MLYYMCIQAARKEHSHSERVLPARQADPECLDPRVERGVDVQVMVPGPNIDLPMVRLASRLHYGPMLQAGIKFYEYQPTMMHNKTLVVDGVFSTLGSINFDTRSMGKKRGGQPGVLRPGLCGTGRRDVQRRLETVPSRHL